MSRSNGFAAVFSGMRTAVQWRLLLLWLLIMLIPVALVALPLWRMLSGLLDASVHSAQWASGFRSSAMAGDGSDARASRHLAAVAVPGGDGGR